MGTNEPRRQLRRRRIRFTALDNGFLACAKPDVLQTLCQTLSEADIEAFFTRWQAQIPFPLLPVHQARGFSYQLSLLQLGCGSYCEHLRGIFAAV